jgi:hypothetical protein
MMFLVQGHGVYIAWVFTWTLGSVALGNWLVVGFC